MSERSLSEVVDAVRAAASNDFSGGAEKLSDEQVRERQQRAHRARLDKLATEDPRERQAETKRFITTRRTIIGAVDAMPTGRKLSSADLKAAADDVIKTVGGGAPAQASIRDVIQRAALHVADGEKGAAVQLADEAVAGIVNGDAAVGAPAADDVDLDALSPAELAGLIRRG
jgi:hypothetical protein